MIYIILGLALGLIFFIATIKAYTIGVKHGKQLSQSIVPNVNINPVKTFKDYLDKKEQNKNVDLVNEGWNGENGINNYDPYKAVKEVDK